MQIDEAKFCGTGVLAAVLTRAREGRPTSPNDAASRRASGAPQAAPTFIDFQRARTKEATHREAAPNRAVSLSDGVPRAQKPPFGLRCPYSEPMQFLSRQDVFLTVGSVVSTASGHNTRGLMPGRPTILGRSGPFALRGLARRAVPLTGPRRPQHLSRSPDAAARTPEAAEGASRVLQGGLSVIACLRHQDSKARRITHLHGPRKEAPPLATGLSEPDPVHAQPRRKYRWSASTIKSILVPRRYATWSSQKINGSGRTPLVKVTSALALPSVGIGPCKAPYAALAASYCPATAQENRSTEPATTVCRHHTLKSGAKSHPGHRADTLEADFLRLLGSVRADPTQVDALTRRRAG